MKNKAQLQIQEMTFMLVAVVLFFVLGGMFALSIVYADMQKKATELKLEEARVAVVNFANTPEFNCGKPGCIDADKLIVMMGRTAYKNYWKFSNIRIDKSSGFAKNESKLIKCNLVNYPDCDYFVVLEKKVDNQKPVTSFASICWQKVEGSTAIEMPGKCEIARVTIYVEDSSNTKTK
jgi:hypothetical protein